ncbi:MAG: hypothetical protein RIR26_1396 [Pseudomonadota bacterium]|jgi:hypothetical protein
MKLSLIGRGVRPWEHLTLAGLRALKDADIVLGIEPDQGAWQALAQEFSLPPVKPLDFLYRDGATDEQNYEAFLKFVLEACDFYNHIALVVAGHPRLGVSIAHRLSQKSLPAHIELDVIEGISSFDALSNDLATDPLEKGTAVLDANRLLLFRYALEPSLDTYIYHVSSVGNSHTDYGNCSLRNQLPLLVGYLRNFYPANKTMKLCKAANFTGGASEYIDVTLGTLLDCALLIDPGTTLFIPGEKPKSINTTFLSELRSGYVASHIHSC